MYEGFLTALRTPLVCEDRQFISAKTPTPISYTSRKARTTLIQLTLNPAVFVIRPDAESEADTGSTPHTVLELVTQYGNVAVDLQNDDAARRAGGSEEKCPADPLQFFLSGGDINHQPYADNCRLAWLCNDYRTDPRDRDTILAALTSARQLTLTEAARECRFAVDPISAVLSLVCADFAVADLKSAPIGFHTRISIRRRKRTLRMSGVMFPGDNPASLLAKLQALTRDIGRIRAGIEPSAAELDAAPVLHGWAPASREAACLIGSVRAHPLFGSGGLITTSEVYAIDPARGWARTYSRFYVLGARSDAQEARHE